MSVEAFGPYEELRRSGKVIIFGGGCYGALFSARIKRAKQRGMLTYQYQLIVDLDSSCKAISGNESEDSVFFNGDWLDFIESYYRYFANERDYIVLPCNTPHFLFKLYCRMFKSSNLGNIEIFEISDKLGYPFEVFNDDTIFVSFAKWKCPFLCIEPKICPATRDKRDWNVKKKLYDFISKKEELFLSGVYVFENDFYTNGVAVISAKKILDNYSKFVSQLSIQSKVYMLATLSKCHGAISFFTASIK